MKKTHVVKLTDDDVDLMVRHYITSLEHDARMTPIVEAMKSHRHAELKEVRPVGDHGFAETWFEAEFEYDDGEAGG